MSGDQDDFIVHIFYILSFILIQWKLVTKRSDITKPSYHKVIMVAPDLYIFFFSLPLRK